MSYRFEIAAGKSKRFPVGGKYCEDDIVVTAVGGAPAPDVPDEPVAPEYSEGLLIKWYVYGDNHYCVNGRGSCTDSVVRIPEYYDDGVHGRDLVTRLGSVTEWNSETWMDETNYVFHNDELLEEIYLPSGMELLQNGNSLTNCPNLKRVYGVCDMNSFELRGLPSLEYVSFTEKTYFIGGGIGSGNGAVYDFSKCTAVPSFDSYGFGNEFGTDPVILVPAELYDEWKSATNWVLYADYIVAKGQENAQEKTVEITENGSYEVIPDEGKLLRKVTANVAVEGAQNYKEYHVNVPTAVATQFVTVVSGDLDVAAHYADDTAFVTVRKMTNNDIQGTALIAQGNHSFGTVFGMYVNRKTDGSHGYLNIERPLTTEDIESSNPFVKCTSDGDIMVYAYRLQNNFGGADYIITFSW